MAGGSTSDQDQRRTAAQNIAYYLDAIYNGMGTGIPDPNGKWTGGGSKDGGDFLTGTLAGEIRPIAP